MGGYEDEAGKAARLSMRLIDFFADFHHSNLDFRLQTFCVGKCNTKRGRNGHNEPKISETVISYNCYYTTYDSKLLWHSIGGVVFQLKEPTLGPQPADLNRHFISSRQMHSFKNIVNQSQVWVNCFFSIKSWRGYSEYIAIGTFIDKKTVQVEENHHAKGGRRLR